MTENPTPPERTYDQRMAALEVANRRRTRRARLKVALKAGDVTLEPVIVLDLEGIRQATGIALERGDLDTMRIYDALLAAPKYGRVKANRILTRTRISPSKTLGGMSVRQRRELLIELGYVRPTPTTILDEEA